MRGTQAKRLRKLAYGDDSQRQNRDYDFYQTGVIENKTGCNRWRYLAMKEYFKKGGAI